MTYLIFDTETTGIPAHPRAKDSVQPRIIEWGGILVDHDGNVLDELELLINPGVKLPAKIIEITGITDEDLADAPAFKDVAPGPIRDMFARAEGVVAHNLPFDLTMVGMELTRCGLMDGWPWPRVTICTVQEHAEEWGRRPSLKNLYQWYFGEPLPQSHRALDDVHALAAVAAESGVLKP